MTLYFYLLDLRYSMSSFVRFIAFIYIQSFYETIVIRHDQVVLRILEING